MFSNNVEQESKLLELKEESQKPNSTKRKAPDENIQENVKKSKKIDYKDKAYLLKLKKNPVLIDVVKYKLLVYRVINREGDYLFAPDIMRILGKSGANTGSRFKTLEMFSYVNLAPITLTKAIKLKDDLLIERIKKDEKIIYSGQPGLMVKLDKNFISALNVIFNVDSLESEETKRNLIASLNRYNNKAKSVLKVESSESISSSPTPKPFLVKQEIIDSALEKKGIATPKALSVDTSSNSTSSGMMEMQKLTIPSAPPPNNPITSTAAIISSLSKTSTSTENIFNFSVPEYTIVNSWETSSSITQVVSAIAPEHSSSTDDDLPLPKPFI